MAHIDEEHAVIELGPHVRMTTEETLTIVSRENPTAVVIVYEDEDGDICLRSSGMSRAEAIFLLEKAKLHSLGLDV